MFYGDQLQFLSLKTVGLYCLVVAVTEPRLQPGQMS